MLKSKTVLSGFVTLLILAVLSSSSFAWGRYERSDLVETLENRGYTTLVAALEATGLRDVVATGGPFTVMAPSNQAFEDLAIALGGEGAGDLLDPEFLDPAVLTNTLLYHVFDGKRRFSSLLLETTPETLFGLELLVVKDRWRYFVKSEIGRDVLGDDAKVVRKNIRASNGLINGIDKVLLFDFTSENPTENYRLETIMDIVRFDGRFSVLTLALETFELDGTKLSDILSNPGVNLTLFSPTDEAFIDLLNALGIEAGDLLNDPGTLDVLLYHVLGDEYRAFRLLLKRHVPTLEGSDVRIKWRWRGIKVDNSVIESPNMDAENGIMHAIDSVLLP